MSVAEPRLLWLLLAAPLVLAAGLAAARRAAAFAARCAPAAKAAATRRRALSLGLAVAFAEAGAAAAGSLALAGVAVGERLATEEYAGVEVVLVVDASNSMLVADAGGGSPRLEKALEAARSLVAARPDLAWGLVAVRGAASLLVPPTDDSAAVDEALGFAGPDAVTVPGTSLGAGVRAALAYPGAALRVVVVLSDGEDLRGELGRAAAEARQRGAVVHALGFGGAAPAPVFDAAGAPVPSGAGGQATSARRDANLDRLAAATGGRSLDGADPSSIRVLLERLDAVSAEGSVRARRVPADRSGLLSAIAALCLLGRAAAARLRSRGGLA